MLSGIEIFLKKIFLFIIASKNLKCVGMQIQISEVGRGLGSTFQQKIKFSLFFYANLIEFSALGKFLGDNSTVPGRIS